MLSIIDCFASKVISNTKEGGNDFYRAFYVPKCDSANLQDVLFMAPHPLQWTGHTNCKHYKGRVWPIAGKRYSGTLHKPNIKII